MELWVFHRISEIKRKRLVFIGIIGLSVISEITLDSRGMNSLARVHNLAGTFNIKRP
jgi:hypothetical protein